MGGYRQKRYHLRPGCQKELATYKTIAGRTNSRWKSAEVGVSLVFYKANQAELLLMNIRKEVI